MIAKFVLDCANQLAPGDEGLSRRIANRLRAQSERGADNENELVFVGAKPGDPALIDLAFERNEIATARRIVVLGPYFDKRLRFLDELRERAPRAEITVAIQPEFAVLERTDLLPPRVRLRNAAALQLRALPPFNHAKALLVEGKSASVLAIGSANLSTL